MDIVSPFPPRRVRWPVMLQSWRSLTFLHWRYRPSEVRPLIPPQLSLDTLDGAAWVGLTPFLLTSLRAPRLPALPWISQFPETNVRTYVRGPDGEPGVWFFTLEAASLAAVLGARLLYGLPYRWADMHVSPKTQTVEYASKRRHPFGSARSSIEIEIGDTIPQTPFELFLTARFRLYSLLGKRLAYADIEHQPWVLAKGRVRNLAQNIIEGSGVPAPRGEPTVQYSFRTDVRIGILRLY